MKSYTNSSKEFLLVFSDTLSTNLSSDQLLELVKDLCDKLPAAHKRNMLESLISCVTVDHFSSLRISASLHSNKECLSQSDCHDFVTWLPIELVLRIFSYFHWKTITRCSMVNRTWRLLSRHPGLYRRLCALPEWSLPCAKVMSRTSADLQPSALLPDPVAPTDNIEMIDWYSVFKSRCRLRQNWLQGRHRIRKFTGHSGTVHCVAYDAYRIASGSSDATIRVWNVRTNAGWSVQTLRGHSCAVKCLQLLPYGCSSTSQVPNTADRWCPASGSLAPADPWQPPPDALLVSGSSDTTVKVWQISAYGVNCSRIACIESFRGHGDTVTCLQADSEKVISGSYDRSLRWWNLRSGHLQRVYRGHTSEIICLTYDDHLLYSGSLDNTVRVWCLASGVCRYILQNSSPSPRVVSSLHLDRVGQRLLIGHQYGPISVWRLPAASLDRQHAVDSGDSPVLAYLTEQFSESESSLAGTLMRCIAGDAWHIVCGCDDKTLKVWRTDTNQLVSVLQGHEDGVTCLAVGPSVVVSGSFDRSIILYDFGVA